MTSPQPHYDWAVDHDPAQDDTGGLYIDAAGNFIDLSDPPAIGRPEAIAVAWLLGLALAGTALGLGLGALIVAVILRGLIA